MATEAQIIEHLRKLSAYKERPECDSDGIPHYIDSGNMDDPPTASHITPEGKRTAEGAVTPQPGDVVILVRFPTPKECREWSDEFGKIGELATVMSDDDEPCPFCVSVVRSEGCMNWPLSCVEVVNGVDK